MTIWGIPTSVFRWSWRAVSTTCAGAVRFAGRGTSLQAACSAWDKLETYYFYCFSLPLSQYIYMCIYIYIYIYLWFYIYIYIYLWLHIYIYMWLYIYINCTLYILLNRHMHICLHQFHRYTRCAAFNRIWSLYWERNNHRVFSGVRGCGWPSLCPTTMAKQDAEKNMGKVC